MTIINKSDLNYPIRITNNQNQLINVSDCDSFISRYYTTDKAKAAVSKFENNTYTNIIDDDIAVINSADLSIMNNGVLNYEYIYSVTDNTYEDNTYNVVVTGNTNYYIKLNNNNPVDLSDYSTTAENDIKYVHQIINKQLSTNDYTTAEKAKLASLNNYDDTAIINSINEIPNSYHKNELYTKSETDTLIEECRIDINLTDEQLAKLNVNITPIETELSEINIFPIKGKNMLVLGDSLSSANSGTMEEPAVGSWCKQVKNKLKLNNESRVIANGGATLADRTDTALKTNKVDWTGSNNVLSNQVYSALDYKAKHPDYEPNIIIIMIGTNNISTNYPDNNLDNIMGDWNTIMFEHIFNDNDYDMIDVATTDGLTHYNTLREFRKKLYGAYKWVIETLLTNFPNTNLYICPPLQNSEGRGRNMFEFYPHIKKIAEYYSVPLINTHSESYLSYFSNNRKVNGWDNNWYTFDGTHPDWIGQPLIGNYIAKYLSTNYFEKPKVTAIRTGNTTDDTYYTITTQSTNDLFGTVNPSGATSVKSGNSLTVSVTPKTNYRIYELLVDGISVEKSNQYTFSNITSNHTLIADFELIPITNAPPVLNSIVINNNAEITNNPNVNVVMNIEGNITYYKIGITSDLNNTEWIAYNTNSINYTLSNTGSTTIYVQLKNEYGESEIKSDTINYSESEKQKAILSFCDAPYPGAFEAGIWKTPNKATALDFKGTNNEVFGKIISTKDNSFSPFNSRLIGYITGDNSGLYPDWVLEKNCNVTSPKIAEIEFQLKNGTYKISLLFNVSSECEWKVYLADAKDCSIEINGITKTPTKIIDNPDTLLVFDNVQCVDGIISIKISCSANQKRMCLTCLEIEEL